MLKKFHPTSQREMTKPIVAFKQRSLRFKHIGESIKEALEFWKKTDDEKRAFYLEQINNERSVIMTDPQNPWRVYGLCKKVYELAEHDRVNFNGASYIEKLNFIRQLVPFADSGALEEGVAEYHDSRQRENWQMQYLKEEKANNEQVNFR